LTMTRKPQQQGSAESSETLRWFAGVPIGTNPLILMDLGMVLAILWAGSFVFLIFLQLLFGKTLNRIQISAAVGFASFLALFIIGAFLVISFLIFQNRYVALFRFDSEGVFCESIRKGPGSFRESMHWRPFPIEPVLNAAKSVTRMVPWGRIHTLEPAAGLQVIFLKGTKKTLMRIYCPDQNTFEQALAFGRARLFDRFSGEGNSSASIDDEGADKFD
jgi:hypothetical protein